MINDLIYLKILELIIIFILIWSIIKIMTIINYILFFIKIKLMLIKQKKKDLIILILMSFIRNIIIIYLIIILNLIILIIKNLLKLMKYLEKLIILI